MDYETEWFEPPEIEETTDFNFYEMDFFPEPETEANTPAVIYEDFSGAPLEATEEVITVVSVENLDTHFSNLANVNLFGSFLIAGVLVGLALLRNRYDN